MALSPPSAGAGDVLEFVLAHNVGARRHERRDHGALVPSSARDPWRLLAEVPVAPLSQASERHGEVSALGGEPVLVALGALAGADAREDALLDQPVEPVGEDVAGDSEALLELIEATQPK